MSVSRLTQISKSDDIFFKLLRVLFVDLGSLGDFLALPGQKVPTAGNERTEVETNEDF
jgi:hypothetical protein